VVIERHFLSHTEIQLLKNSRNVSSYVIVPSFQGENELARMTACCTAKMDCSTVFKETPHLCLTQVVQLCVKSPTCPDRTKQTIYLKTVSDFDFEHRSVSISNIAFV